jgi:hypothetical protein
MPSAVLRGPTVRALLKSYLLLGLAVIVLAIVVFSLRLNQAVERQAGLTTRLLADLAAERLLSENPNQLRELREAMDELSVPVILTDAAGLPVFWNASQVGIPLPENPDEFQNEDPRNPRDPVLVRLLSKVEEFDRHGQPLSVADPKGGTLFYLHYGENELSRRLTVMPLLEAALIVAFMGVALVAFRNLKRSEERSLWVGMAKETAHQMGTPLTSMSGWLALLGEKDEEGALATDGSSSSIDRRQVLGELERDHQRLAKVSDRFSQIGSRPKLVSARVDHLVENACAYFHRRLPHLKSHVELISSVEETPLAPVNPELLEWALENLIKNALDAIDKDRGLVRVSCRYDPDDLNLVITVTDNGKGMTPAVQRRIFSPGFSTREGGWGLGLVLVKRIVDEYHGGSIDVAWTEPGQGSTLRIKLKTR